MNCEQVRQIHAYHDGQLPADQRRQVEEHVGRCPDCAAELAELQKLSALFGSAMLPQISAAALRNLHARVDAVWETGVLRIAEVLTGAAAAVLIGGLVLLWRDRPAAPPPAASWEWAMVHPAPEEQLASADSGGAEDPMLLAQWMTQAVSQGTDHE